MCLGIRFILYLLLVKIIHVSCEYGPSPPTINQLRKQKRQSAAAIWGLIHFEDYFSLLVVKYQFLRWSVTIRSHAKFSLWLGKVKAVSSLWPDPSLLTPNVTSELRNADSCRLPPVTTYGHQMGDFISHIFSWIVSPFSQVSRMDK